MLRLCSVFLVLFSTVFAGGEGGVGLNFTVAATIFKAEGMGGAVISAVFDKLNFDSEKRSAEIIVTEV